VTDDDIRPWDGLGYRVRKERKALGLTIVELARRAGVNRHTLEKIERGESHPQVRHLWAIGEALCCNLHYLVTGELGWVAPQQVRGRGGVLRLRGGDQSSTPPGAPYGEGSR
jgi:transcriptional regulator with XRE-family HTH domain